MISGNLEALFTADTGPSFPMHKRGMTRSSITRVSHQRALSKSPQVAKLGLTRSHAGKECFNSSPVRLGGNLFFFQLRSDTSRPSFLTGPSQTQHVVNPITAGVNFREGLITIERCLLNERSFFPFIFQSLFFRSFFSFFSFVPFMAAQC